MAKRNKVMKAVVFTRYGGPEELHVAEVPAPQPKDDEVLIRVRAVAINDWDWALLRGDFISRFSSGFGTPSKIQILGSDVAGTVEAAGKLVKAFRPGQEVYGDLSGRWGGFAEYVCTPEKMLAVKPAAMSFEQAAAIPQAGMLAVQGLIDKGNIQKGQTLLINGAGGGVGTFGIQIARQFGVHVTGVDNAGKQDLMREAGFDSVIDYAKNDFTRMGLQYDLILDTKTNRSVFDLARALQPAGTYVTVGGSIPRLLQILLWSPIVSSKKGRKFRIVALRPNKDLDYMNSLFLAGKMNPVIDGPYRLDQTPEAFGAYVRGEQRGKMVISV